MAKSTEGKRRFAPIPIETTFEQRRKTGPAAELTPSPSPRSPSPPPREKRRFAPQLVESSTRRSRRVGDVGPATRPTDKTDITPYTNHIYALKSRRRYDSSSPDERRKGHARRESCDDEIAGGVFDLVAKDAQRKLQEMAMTAFPNSGERIGGAEHFYVREGSDDDHPRGRTTTRGPGPHRPSRRNSSEEEVGWAIREMQEHAEQLAKLRIDRVSSVDLDKLDMESPPADPMWTTQARASLSGSLTSSLGPIGEQQMPLIGEESLPTIGETSMPYIPPESPPIRPIGETFMPYIPSAPPGKAAAMPYAPASQIPPETGFGNHGPFSRPFGGFRHDRHTDLDRDRNLHRLRTVASPPMLGKDLTFRTCPSPKQTKLEPDHLWDLETGTTEDPNRDPTGQNGLWHGYCYTNMGEALAPTERPQMITTPYQPGTPGDPFAAEFGATAPVSLSEEPTPTDTRATTPSATLWTSSRKAAKSRARNPPEPKGLHMLQGLDERLRKEKAAADLEEKIVAEFDDAFVTQVYNYLSLGYPAMARSYDEELSKISRISVGDLERDDDAIMDLVSGGKARGYILTDRDASGVGDAASLDGSGSVRTDGSSEDGKERCPRWRALKLYIYEWARQHPDLAAISPLAWGVRERRGSWGL